MCAHCYLFSQMSDIRRLHPRLECLAFRARFNDEMEELLPVSHPRQRLLACGLMVDICSCLMNGCVALLMQNVSAVISACREIKTSTKFAKLLEVRIAF